MPWNQQPPQEKRPPRVGNIAAGFIIAIALVIDGLQFLLDFTVLLSPLTIFVGFVSVLFFNLWFLVFHRVSFTQGKYALAKMGAVMGTAVITVIPFLNGIPEITLGVLTTIILSRLEDAHLSIGSIAQTAARVAAGGPASKAQFFGKVIFGSGARPVEMPEGAQEYPA